MTGFFPKFYISLGVSGNSTIYIKNSSDEWIEFTNYESFKVMRKQNQVSEFEIKLFDIQSSDKDFVKEFAEVMFFSDTNLILKGRIQKVTYETAYECTATGYGMEAKLLDKEVLQNDNTSATWQEAKRGQWTNVSAQTVANELLSSNTDGSSPWIIQPNTTGLFDTDYGNITVRFEHANRLNSLAKVSEAIDYEWWVSQDAGFIDYFNIASLQPDNTSATVSQETYAITGANTNSSVTSKETDVSNMANYISGLFYGDGVNQLRTSAYNASPTYSTLSSDITSSDTTISLVDASDFDSSGTIRIMEEQVTYSGKSGNDLTGCTRGANSTTAYSHKKNVYVEKHVTVANAEADSSIGDNGLLDITLTNRDIIDRETGELVVSRELLDRKDPIVRIVIIPNEPQTEARDREIGELVTITDSESGISDDYRIVGMTYTSTYGYLEMEIECSNRSLTFIEQMKKQQEANENLSKYMQGATNIYAINEAENCDSTHYLNLRFFIPNEAVAINRILLNFKLEDYRAYSASNANESSHTHGIPSLTVNSHTHGIPSLTVNSHTHGIPSLTVNYHTHGIPSLTVSGTSSSNESSHTHTGYISGFPDTDYPVYYSSGSPSHLAVNGLSFTIPINNSTTSHNHTISGQSTSSNTTGSTGSTTSSNTSAAGSAHTHGITYGISEATLTSPSVDLYTGIDGGSMTLKDTYTSNQTEIDLTTEASVIGTGNWMNIQFRPNKNMRIEANAYIQIFIQSVSV